MRHEYYTIANNAITQNSSFQVDLNRPVYCFVFVGCSAHLKSSDSIAAYTRRATSMHQFKIELTLEAEWRYTTDAFSTGMVPCNTEGLLFASAATSSLF